MRYGSEVLNTPSLQTDEGAFYNHFKSDALAGLPRPDRLREAFMRSRSAQKSSAQKSPESELLLTSGDGEASDASQDTLAELLPLVEAAKSADDTVVNLLKSIVAERKSESDAAAARAEHMKANVERLRTLDEKALVSKAELQRAETTQTEADAKNEKASHRLYRAEQLLALAIKSRDARAAAKPSAAPPARPAPDPTTAVVGRLVEGLRTDQTDIGDADGQLGHRTPPAAQSRKVGGRRTGVSARVVGRRALKPHWTPPPPKHAKSASTSTGNDNSLARVWSRQPISRPSMLEATQAETAKERAEQRVAQAKRILQVAIELPIRQGKQGGNAETRSHTRTQRQNSVAELLPLLEAAKTADAAVIELLRSLLLEREAELKAALAEAE